jgi:hypothetical protein
MDGRNIRRKSCLNRQQNRFILFVFAAPAKAGGPRLELYTDGATVDKWLQREMDETRQDGFRRTIGGRASVYACRMAALLLKKGSDLASPS